MNLYLEHALDRFWSRVDIGEEDECWNWLGGFFPSGYGVFSYRPVQGEGDKTWRVHRFSWLIHHGCDIPIDLVIRHRCDNKACVNPLHLELGTNFDNVQDRNQRERTARGAKTGHAKLRPAIVKKIRRDPRGHRPVAKQYGVSRSLVQLIRQRKAWRYVTD